MAAFTANTNTTVILVDTASRAVVKDVLYMTGANDQSARLVVNCDVLQGRTMILTGILGTPLAPLGLISGEVVTAQDAVVGYVGQQWTPNTTHKVIEVILASSAAPFSNNDVLTGDRSNNAFTVAAGGAVSVTPKVSIIGAWWSVNGSPNTSISVEFVGADCAFTASGTGWFGKGNLPEAITSVGASANGNISVSTYGILAKGGYTLVLDLRKEQGFGQRPIY